MTVQDNSSNLFLDSADCALLLVDCQPGLSLASGSRPLQEIVENVCALATTANVFDVPVVATTSATDHVSGPIWPALHDLLLTPPIERKPLNAYLDTTVRAAIEATGRRQIIVAGLLTEICVSLPALSLLEANYGVFIAADCCGGMTAETHSLALRRVEMAGGRPTSWIQVLLEFQKDWTSQKTYAGATGVLARYGGGYGLLLQHARDMLASPAANPHG